MTKANMPMKLYITALLFGATALAILMHPHPALAQECDSAYEVITKLRKPVVGSYNLWDTIYGEKSRTEQVKGMTPAIPGNNVVMASEAYDEKTPQVTDLILAEIDRRGRPVWEKIHFVKGLQSIIKIMNHEENYIVLANTNHEKSGKTLWIGFFNASGELEKEYRISSNGNDLEATDFILAHGAQTLLVSAVKTNHNQKISPSAILKWFDLKSRKVIKDVTFAIGSENRINSIAHNGEGYYFIAGSIRENDGRWSGWLANINKDGGFVWQRNMARGMGGRFKVVEPLNDDYVVVAGEAMPSGSIGKKAAWIAVINSMNSEIAWQRYYRDDYNLSAIDLKTYEDGQIAALINANDTDNKDDIDYTRLLILNPRGMILKADGYYNGAGSGAFGMMTGKNNEHIMYGFTNITYQVEIANSTTTPKETKQMIDHQGWIVAGSPPDQYSDPCRPISRILQ